MTIDVIIPAFDESGSIGLVLEDLPSAPLREVIVVDNGSSDGTAEVAGRHGATVVHESRHGYGSACLAGLAELARRPRSPDIVVFLDADYSDHPDELPELLEPLIVDRADLVIGSRALGNRERGALLPQARFGNWLASRLIRRLYGMQVKAARAGVRYAEVPVSYRRRIGVSKITGTWTGTIRAGYKILFTIFRYR